MEELNQLSRTISKKPYFISDVNPYVLIFKNPHQNGIWHLYFNSHTDSGSVWMHLIEGKDRALMIDTAFGIGDLKGLVESLTTKPYDVINTHFHGDHSGGNGQFQKVFIHEYDVPYLKESLADDRRLLPAEDFYVKEDIIPNSFYEVVGVKEGYKFRLGDDEEVEVVHMPGHAAGGCMLFYHKRHMLFSGDAILATPTLILDKFPATNHTECLTVTAFRNALQKLEPHFNEVERIYPGHGKLDLDSSYLTDMLDCCSAVIEAPEDYELYDYVTDQDQRQIKCVGKAMIVYSASRVS
ncbi:MAG TPA: MBL fold metallo-hydrolase [Mobilitalea sp.]|nr:MBL fold metallo-hydrolase [Mobilitalea sp.]